jgi:hypothetical protein
MASLRLLAVRSNFPKWTGDLQECALAPLCPLEKGYGDGVLM